MARLGREREAPSNGRRSRRLADILVREGSAILFAGALLYVLWGGYEPDLGTPASALWHGFAVAAVSLVYVLLQAIAAVTLPLRRESGPLGDLLVSLLPVFVLGYTVIEWIRLGQEPTAFQLVVALLGALATVIDVIVFTWFSLRLNRLAPEIVPID